MNADQHPTSTGPERRAIGRPVELRANEGAPSTIVGYAALFNEETVIGSYYGFREVIAPGAFADAITNDDVRALFNHDVNIVLGRNVSKTLRLEEDETGLRYEIDLPDTAAARDVKTLIERGDVSGSSFAFRVEADEDDEWDYTPVKDGLLPLRTIRKVSLFDVSPVTYPAYEGTTVSARSAERAKPAAAATSDVVVLPTARARRELDILEAEL
jgi:uncharacterized protein